MVNFSFCEHLKLKNLDKYSFKLFKQTNFIKKNYINQFFINIAFLFLFINFFYTTINSRN